jgi:hypothetical protein
MGNVASLGSFNRGAREVEGEKLKVRMLRDRRLRVVLVASAKGMLRSQHEYMLNFYCQCLSFRGPYDCLPRHISPRPCSSIVIA